jgi:transcriptional regulator with XRE-family HTH domain
VAIEAPSKWDNPEEIGRRLRAVRKARGMVQEQVAKVVGKTRAAISQWELGEVQADIKSLERAAASLRCGLNWLISGEGEPPEGVTISTKKAKVKIGRPEGKRPEPLPKPLYPGVIEEAVAGIGAGDATADPAAALDWWRLPPHVFAEFRCDAEACRLYRVLSDSMKPTIHRGAWVLIDHGQRTPQDGQVFAIDNGFSIILKRLTLSTEKKKANKISLRSDSDRKEPVVVDLKEVKIIGRLIAQVTPIS